MGGAPHISARAQIINGSGIRRVFDMKARMKDPIDLSIGQPDFPVPRAVKDAAISAIERDLNGYTPTYGIPPLLDRLAKHLRADLGWDVQTSGQSGSRVLVTSGTSGALVLACLATLDAGDEVIIPDPWFVLYPHLATLCQARSVPCDTYPDFRLSAERIEPLITQRTRMVIACSPGNPSGVVAPERDCADVLDLCRRRGILLVSDEIYDAFTYNESRTQASAADPSRLCCPSPARLAGSQEQVLVVRGFGKTYGITGWRLGYAAGPAGLIEQMAKLQQYTYVCTPSPLQMGALAALDVDMSPAVAEYERRRDLVVEKLRGVTDVAMPGGAFYAFFKVPPRMNMTAEQFFQLARDHNVLVVPGHTFSNRDTHLRLSFATTMDTLERGLDVLVRLLKG